MKNTKLFSLKQKRTFQLITMVIYLTDKNFFEMSIM